MNITKIKLGIIKINQCTFESENIINGDLIVLLSQLVLVPRSKMTVMLLLVGLKTVCTCHDSCTDRLSIKKWYMRSVLISR